MRQRLHTYTILRLAVAIIVIISVILLAPVAVRQAQAWLAARPSPVPATPHQQQAIIETFASPSEISWLSLPWQLPPDKYPWFAVPDRTALPRNNGINSSLEVTCKGFQAWLQSNYPWIP